MTDTEFKFKTILPRKRCQTSYDLNETVKMAGKEFSRYQAIQEAREDTEIYPTLEKYGCIDKLLIDPNKTYADFQEFKDLRSMKDQQIKAMKMWQDLPYDVRMKFDNNMHEFMEKGEQYVQDLIKQQTPDLSQTTSATTEPQAEPVKE